MTRLAAGTVDKLQMTLTCGKAGGASLFHNGLDQADVGDDGASIKSAGNDPAYDGTKYVELDFKGAPPASGPGTFSRARPRYFPGRGSGG